MRYEFILPVDMRAPLTEVEIALIKNLLADSHAPIFVSPEDIRCVLVDSEES